MNEKTLFAAGALCFLWILESLFPFYDQFKNKPGERLRHDWNNIALGVINALCTAVVFSTLFAVQETQAEMYEFGLLRWLAWSSYSETFLAIVLFDFWMYLWHRLNHRIAFLWRFHRMHHSEPKLNASSGLRFHFGEICLSNTARLLIVPLLGISLWQLVLYESLLLPLVLFHHSNVRLPRILDYGLLALIVTPTMHRVHHSTNQPETDSNFSSIFPYWDMLLRTFRLRDNAAEIEIGLRGFEGREWQGFWGMLKTPFRK